ncbi:MAG TPA: GNAT family N-acetyltransferase [Jiangellaceae bacterium]|nr:GNAT family N-acetyltransferase [Jiangellaceae bacterium]
MQQLREDRYEVDDDVERLQLDVVHGFLREAYWSPGVPRDVVERAIRNSLVVGLYAPDGRQVGMARAVTDRATFAWIADVFVLPQHRGRGLGRFVVEALLEHPDMSGLRRLMLATADAHELYRSYGFEDLADPESYLVRRVPPEVLYSGGSGNTPDRRPEPSR